VARPAAAAGAVRRGGALTVEGTARALLRSNPTAVLRAGPQFPGSGGRSGASGRPPNPATVLAAARCCRRMADEAVAGGVRFSFQQSHPALHRLGRSASLGDVQRHGQEETLIWALR
jgi:hypothetical protein